MARDLRTVGRVPHEGEAGVDHDHDTSVAQLGGVDGDGFAESIRTAHSGTSGKSQIRTVPERSPAAITT